MPRSMPPPLMAASGVPAVKFGALLGALAVAPQTMPPPPPETDRADLRQDIRGCTVPERQVACAECRRCSVLPAPEAEGCGHRREGVA